jgi:hypothetical protein
LTVIDTRTIRVLLVTKRAIAYSKRGARYINHGNTNGTNLAENRSRSSFDRLRMSGFKISGLQDDRLQDERLQDERPSG